MTNILLPTSIGNLIFLQKVFSKFKEEVECRIIKM